MLRARFMVLVLPVSSRPGMHQSRAVHAGVSGPTFGSKALGEAQHEYLSDVGCWVEGRPFTELMYAVRAGNEDAARALVHLYEPALRRAIRPLLQRYRLNRVLDIADISQVVFASFFERAMAGHFQLDEPDQVLRLLVTMARRPVVNEARRYCASRRDRRREDECLSEHGGLAWSIRGCRPA